MRKNHDFNWKDRGLHLDNHGNFAWACGDCGVVFSMDWMKMNAEDLDEYMDCELQSDLRTVQEIMDR